MAIKIKPLTVVKGIGALAGYVAAPFTAGATLPAAIGLTASTATDVGVAKMESDAIANAKKQANANAATNAQAAAKTQPQGAGIAGTVAQPEQVKPIIAGNPSDTTKQAGSWSAGAMIPPGISNGINHTQETPGEAPSAMPSIASQSGAINQQLNAEASPFSKLTPEQQRSQQAISKKAADADKAAQDKADAAKSKAIAGIGTGIQASINDALKKTSDQNAEARSTFDTIFNNAKSTQPLVSSAPQPMAGEIPQVSNGITPTMSVAPMPPPVQNPNFGPDPDELLKKQLAMSDRNKKTQIKSANQELKHFLNLIYRGNHGR